MILKDRKLTQDEADELITPMSLDLTAYYKLLQDDILEILSDENLTPDEMIEKVNMLLG
jgi:hypothetical protein